MRHLGSRRTMAPAVALTAAVLLLSACGGSEDATEKSTATSKTKSSVPPTATGSLEEIAAESDCDKINVSIDVDEVRQGVCRTDHGRYVLATFKTQKGKQDWLAASKPMAMGGRYLVGEEWVAVGHPKTIKSLRTRLGGKVEQGEMQHHGHADPSSGGDKHNGDQEQSKNDDGHHGKH
jgi:hypothetical protein